MGNNQTSSLNLLSLSLEWGATAIVSLEGRVGHQIATSCTQRRPNERMKRERGDEIDLFLFACLAGEGEEEEEGNLQRRNVTPPAFDKICCSE